jgi:phosphatidate cytidylyltransferase
MLPWQQLDSHKKRLVTGTLLTVPVLAILAFGPYWSWCLLISLAIAAGLWELQGMVFSSKLSPLWSAVFLLGGMALPVGAMLAGFQGLQLALILAFFSSCCCMLIFSPLDPRGLARLSHYQLCWLYIPYLLSYGLLLGRHPDGVRWVFYLLLVTAPGDIAAFYAGRKFGRRKLYPAVSPNKTVEGAVGGLCASLVFAGTYAWFALPHVDSGHLAILTLLLAALGQVGDLVESMIKRICGKKDSSQLLPGHGGLLDRVDSLLFVLPIAWFYLQWNA